MRLGDLDALEQFFLHESKRLREFMNSEDCDQEERKYISTFLPTVEWARKTVHGISTIDAVPVVRCPECKYQEDCFSQIGHWSRDHILEKNIYEYHKIEFCSYGERKDGEG